MESRTQLQLATVAALLATAGDLTMLLVANALRSGHDLRFASRELLAIGGALGVLALPFFALGYHAVADAMRPAAPRAARVVAICGLATGAVGALIHGLTAWSIHSALVAATPVDAPLEAVLQEGWLLLAWGVGALLVLVASVALVRASAPPQRAVPPRLAWLNPAVVTVAVGLAALPWELGRSYLLPAAPNVAHVVFFAAFLMAARQRRTPFAAAAPAAPAAERRGA